MITHRPIEASTDVVSYGAGILIQSKRGARLHIGQQAFDLFSVRDTSWARDSLTDHKIAAALKNTSTAQISAVSAKKPFTTFSDRFDLTGAEGAYQAIGKACGLIAETRKKPAHAHKKRH